MNSNYFISHVPEDARLAIDDCWLSSFDRGNFSSG